MTTDRIKEIQSKTAYPDSISVQQALLQVWNECEQEQLRIADVSICLERAKKYARHQHFLGSQGSELVEFEDWAQD
jgi:hypothetical protein